jgi:cellulose synthase/poly-beta-1,6-N-acetylglucosamine synthase-like glycosyltransferase
LRVSCGKLRALDVFTLLTVGVLVVLYAWTIYNLPTLVAGLRRTLRRQGWSPVEQANLVHGAAPRFSIIVAARSEERVIGRLLNRLTTLDYSKNLYEVIVVEDGSTDATRQICQQYAEQNPQLIRLFHSEDSRGKPHALNRALAECTGAIVAVLDADSFPNLDLLSRAAEYFEDSSLAAIQGMTMPINRDESMISKLSAYEEAAWFKIYMMGKEDLNLFVPLTGSCAFVRRDVIQELGGWDENSLAEDVELAAKLVDKGWRIKYAPEVQSLQEYPASARQLIKQRTRWFRGYMETWVKYGKLMRTPSRLAIDAEATLFGPLALNLILLSYIMAFAGFFAYHPAVSTWGEVLATSATVLTMVTLLTCGIALVWHLRPHRLRNVVWIPAVFSFWFMQTFIAFYALVLTVLRRNRCWVKTEKSGKVSPQTLPEVLCC